MKTLTASLLALFSLSILANTHTARILKLENTADVYVPGEVNQKGAVHLKYYGVVYHVVPAYRGMKLENGYILTTGPQSKAKVVFNNGDHFYVSPNTQYKIEWKRPELTDKKDASVISLLRGAMRGLIEKDGPRSGMKIKTKNTVLGVRGTDFHVSEKHGVLNVSVLRGEVELLNEKINNKEVKIQTGQTLVKEDNEISLSAITKEDLQVIAKESVIKTTGKEVSKEVEKELLVFESKATEVTKNDIKEYQPQLYKEISETKKEVEMTSDSLALSTVEILKEKAPSKTKKPSRGELEDTSDPYKKYKLKKAE